MPVRPGAEAVADKGWLLAHQWLLLRRGFQLVVLLLFLAGPWWDIWVVKGNLNYSYTLGVLPLTDPLILLQGLLAGQWPQALAWTGAAIVVAGYLVVGGRAYCSWVCPLNAVTDAAHWLRTRLGIKGGAHVTRRTRFAILATLLIVAGVTGSIAWEMVNPVSMLHRGLIFGMGMAWAVVLAVFLFDLFVMRQGWCGHLCPVGAFYGLLGRASLMRIRLPEREACNDCMDCFAVCPEPQVIRAPLKGLKGAAPLITDSACTHCGRCIDVCSKNVFRFGSRFAELPPASGLPK